MNLEPVLHSITMGMTNWEIIMGNKFLPSLALVYRRTCTHTFEESFIVHIVNVLLIEQYGTASENLWRVHE